MTYSNWSLPDSLWAACLILGATSTTAFGQTEIPVRDSRISFVDRTTLSAERSGVLAVVPDEGARVQQGEIVIRLRDDVPQAILKLARARAASDVQVRMAEKSALAAAAEYDAAIEANRISSASSPAFPPTHMTRLRLKAEAAQLQVDAALHEKLLAQLAAEQAEAELRTYHVVAGMDGLVTRIFKHAGEGVQQGESIAQIVNTETLRIEGYVDVQQVEQIHPGMDVQVQVDATAGTASPPLKVSGKLGFVDISVQNLSGVVRVWADIPNQRGTIREGINATMKIIVPKNKP